MVRHGLGDTVPRHQELDDEPPAPACPWPVDLDQWLAGSLDRLTALL